MLEPERPRHTVSIGIAYTCVLMLWQIVHAPLTCNTAKNQQQRCVSDLEECVLMLLHVGGRRGEPVRLPTFAKAQELKSIGRLIADPLESAGAKRSRHTVHLA